MNIDIGKFEVVLRMGLVGNDITKIIESLKRCEIVKKMGVQTEFLKMLDKRGKHKEPAKLSDTMRVGLAIEIYEKVVRDELAEITLALIATFGGFDGADNKQYLLDQVVKELTVTEEKYKEWVKTFQHGKDGDETYLWDTGIAP